MKGPPLLPLPDPPETLDDDPNEDFVKEGLKESKQKKATTNQKPKVADLTDWPEGTSVAQDWSEWQGEPAGETEVENDGWIKQDSSDDWRDWEETEVYDPEFDFGFEPEDAENKTNKP